jgi:tetratricopeptide (TPR) repeat protein
MPTNWYRISRIALPVALVMASLCTYVIVFKWSGKPSQRAIYLSCLRARTSRNWGELHRLAEAWATSQPQSADAWLFRADAAQQQGDFAAAADFLAAVPPEDPKALPAYIALSKLQFGPLNRPHDGVQTCERILKLEPRTTAGHQGLIEFYAMTMQRQKLLRQIRFAIEMSREPPSAYIYYFLIDTMRLANGDELNSAWLKADPDTELFLVAEALHLPEPVPGSAPVNHDKHTRVAALFQRFPLNIELLAYQTNFAIRTGNVPELTRLLKRVPATSDTEDRFWRAKGWLYLNRNEIAKARAALVRSLEIFPIDWAARSWLSDVARRQGNSDEADHLDKLVRQAKHLRDALTASNANDAIPHNLLSELAAYATQCGDKPFADSLRRRLRL